MFAGQAGLELLILLNPGNIRKHHHTQPAVPKIHEKSAGICHKCFGGQGQEACKERLPEELQGSRRLVPLIAVSWEVILLLRFT